MAIVSRIGSEAKLTKKLEANIDKEIVFVKI